jgi:hypothetical protein
MRFSPGQKGKGMALRIRACQFGIALVTILSGRPWKPHPFLIGYSFSAEVIAVGYTLTSDVREDRLFILEGKGSNGKTVFLIIFYWKLTRLE